MDTHPLNDGHMLLDELPSLRMAMWDWEAHCQGLWNWQSTGAPLQGLVGGHHAQTACALDGCAVAPQESVALKPVCGLS